MKCPECNGSNWKVIATRQSGNSFRRRRECECGHRVTTAEAIVEEECIQNNYTVEQAANETAIRQFSQKYSSIAETPARLEEIATMIRDLFPPSLNEPNHTEE